MNHKKELLRGLWVEPGLRVLASQCRAMDSGRHVRNGVRRLLLGGSWVDITGFISIMR